MFGSYYKDKNGDTKFGTWCTDSAMMDLLNRRLEANGFLTKSCFFDIRDVITGMASNAKGDFTRFKVEQGPKSHQAKVTKGSFENGGEKCNDPGNEGKTSTFENKFGTQTGQTKKYTVQFKKPECKISGFENPRTVKQEIKDLLATHPEGVFVYSNAGGDHALLIVGYDSDGFKYVDNAVGGGVISYASTWFKKGHDVTEDQMFAAVRCTAYVK